MRPAGGTARSNKPAFDAAVQTQGGGRPPLATRTAAGFLRALARRLSIPDRSVTVAFMDDDAIEALNERFRGKAGPTDVLSFPDGEAGHLGDIAISTPTARRQARRRRHGADREARLLMLHGFLHLMGYDHETDDGQMELLERCLRKEMIP
jgi:probable rRNA maturation factor